jgi:uncharacterized protein (TIGR03118 family)
VRYRALLLIVAAASTLVACSDNSITSGTPNSAYTVTRLVADDPSLGAANVDANLVNAWGLAFGSTGILWVSNNRTGTSTLYDASGAKKPLVVAIPSKSASTGGTPTGIVFNATSDFVIPGSTGALFIFAGEDGTISAWNASTGNAVIVADRSSSGAVYKGLAMASNAGANFLYATNFKQNAVDVFDRTFAFVTSFTDPTVPAGFAPFGIQNIGGLLYVTFAKQLPPNDEQDQPGVGNGFVDIFNPDGSMAKRFASNGQLDSPWGIALAPAGFASASGDILIGNFGDGLIGAYDASTGKFLGTLQDASNTPITIDGLWSLTFGPAATDPTLYFSAGPSGQTHGLLGTITPK